MNEQLVKTSGANLLSSKRKVRKALGGVASTPPPLHPCMSEGFKLFPIATQQNLATETLVNFSFSVPHL